MKRPESKQGKDFCKVVSLRGRREGKRLEETLETGLFYQSLLSERRGKTEEEDQSHFEIAYTINAEELADDERFIQIGEEEILSPCTAQDDKLVPFSRQVIERYEFYDLSTDDIHIVYRIPRKPNFW